LSYDNFCYSPCPARSYFISSVNICKPCFYDCQTCQDSNSCLSCNSTVDFRALDATSNRCRCLDGFYDNLTQSCLKCYYNCTACVAINMCSGCIPGFTLSGVLCLSQCNPRFYMANQTSGCLTCPYDCYTCDNNSNCLTCNNTSDFRVLNAITSRCVPMSGYFDQKVAVAAKCPLNCSSCQSNSSCLACSTGYLGPNQLCGDCPSRYLSNNLTKTCVICPYDCFICDTNKNCLSCNSADQRVLSSTRCLPIQGYYDDGMNSLAPKCQSGCFSCVSAMNCTVCNSGYFLSTVNQCITSCPVRTIVNLVTYSCQSCPYDCYTCDSKNSCLTCSAGDFRKLNSVTSRCVPMIGYY